MLSHSGSGDFRDSDSQTVRSYQFHLVGEDVCLLEQQGSLPSPQSLRSDENLVGFSEALVLTDHLKAFGTLTGSHNVFRALK